MSADAARWERLQALVADALDLAPADRAAFLDRACDDDPVLRAEAAELVDADAGAAARLEPMADRFALGRPAEPAPPLRIGAWRLVREIGRGGMGTVFLAERDDGQYTQRAALKLLRTAAASEDVQARFRAERQLLARLDHPHIARLLDGGLTPPAPDAPDGVPYLVMEHVDGAPLLAYADYRRLDLDARLALFLQMADAVQAAHRQLVVHRDLKPSNVLVAETPAGAPHVKLLDFGIAKLLGDDDALLTQSGLRLLTPEYAAPEQLAGAPVTTATDVYALGLLLYALLTGVRPRTDAPTLSRPSTALLRAPDADALADARAATPPRLARRLRGDLDTIVLKALRDEPDARYATAAEMADDVRRWRERLPVRARPAGAGYRARRFVQRHRAGVAASTLVVLALGAGLAASLWQARAARDAAATAEATLGFLQTTLYTAEPVFGTPDATIRQALDSAAARVDRDLAADPLVAASVHATVGYTYFGLGEYGRAERHHRRAAALYAGLGRAHRLDLGMELNNLALALDAQGRTADALPLFERALALQSRWGDDGHRASVLNAYASALDATGDTDRAERLYRDAIAIWRRQRAPELPLALNNLAVLYEGSRRAAEAVPVVEEAARTLRRGGRVEAARLGPVLTTLGTLYDYTGRPDAARDTLDAALVLLRATFGDDHPKTLLALASRALVDARAGRNVSAKPLARDAFERAHRTLPPDDPIRLHAATVLAQALCGMAPDSVRLGTALARDALAARRDLYGADHYLTATTESVAGVCLVASGRAGEARPLLTHAYAALRDARGDADARTADARHRLAALGPAVAPSRP